MLGGGMRQAGVIAAAALYALENHVDRLAHDHQNAQILAQAVEQTDGLSLESGPVETNLVWVKVAPALGSAADLASRLREQGILVSGARPPDSTALHAPGREPRAGRNRRRGTPPLTGVLKSRACVYRGSLSAEGAGAFCPSHTGGTPAPQEPLKLPKDDHVLQ